MTCQQVIEFLMAYLAGELSPTENVAFEEHLAECPPCVAYLKTYQEAARLGKAAYTCPDDAEADQIPEELIQAILAARTRGS